MLYPPLPMLYPLLPSPLSLPPHIRDTAVQERFRAITRAYFRGAKVSRYYMRGAKVSTCRYHYEQLAY